MASKDTQDEQLEISKRLQLLWLQRMESLLIDGTISSTDMATLSRFLMSNGWTLDVTRISKGLRDKLTSGIDPESFEDDSGVIPLRRQG